MSTEHASPAQQSREPVGPLLQQRLVEHAIRKALRRAAEAHSNARHTEDVSTTPSSTGQRLPTHRRGRGVALPGLAVLERQVADLDELLVVLGLHPRLLARGRLRMLRLDLLHRAIP